MVVKAIFWKELRSLQKNIKSKFVMTVGTILFIFLLLYVKSKASHFSPQIYKNNITYMTAIIGYIIYISNLRFWYEKNMGMLEVLFSLPASINLIILGKIILPILMSIIVSIIFYVISLFVGIVMFNIEIFSIVPLMEVLVISTIFQIFYSVINCYAMWCASLAYAKTIQFISVIMYLGSIFTMYIVPNDFKIYNWIGTWIILIVIGLYAIICYLKITKERAINTLSI